MNNIGISVVIPNYNGRSLLPVIIPPLKEALKNCSLQYEIIVSDDSSTDDSVSFLKQKFPEIVLIINPENKGFSHTVNAGASVAKFSFLFFLNSDVIITENYFTPLLRYFEKEDTFGVMGRIIGWDDEVIQDAAKFPSFHAAKIKTTGNYLLEQPGKNDWLYSMYLSGANAFVNKEKFIELRGFDEIYSPFYVEDYDLSLRAWRVGWKCYYEHFSICRHKTSVSIKSKSSNHFIKTIYYRNKMFLHYIHLSGLQLWMWYIQLIPETLFYLLKGKLYFIKALKLFLLNKQKSKSKFEFNEKWKGKRKLLSVREVANLIFDSLKNKKIIKF